MHTVFSWSLHVRYGVFTWSEVQTNVQILRNIFVRRFTCKNFCKQICKKICNMCKKSVILFLPLHKIFLQKICTFLYTAFSDHTKIPLCNIALHLKVLCKKSFKTKQAYRCNNWVYLIEQT